MPPYSPDFNPDEAIWDWARQEVTANLRQHIDAFFAGLATRTTEVMRRCRRDLQSRTETAIATIDPASPCTHHVDLTLDSV